MSLARPVSMTRIKSFSVLGFLWLAAEGPLLFDEADALFGAG